MAYLTILSILFVHKNLENQSIFRKVLNRRGGVGGVRSLGLSPKKQFFSLTPSLTNVVWGYILVYQLKAIIHLRNFLLDFQSQPLNECIWGINFCEDDSKSVLWTDFPF